MIFADASVVVAILGDEVDANDLLDRLAADPKRLISPVARWEAIAALCRSYGYAPDAATGLVDDFVTTFAVDLMVIGKEESELATSAYARYGRGRHPAALNMGDCFAYACAKSAGARLLYKGEDFALTDLA